MTRAAEVTGAETDLKLSSCLCFLFILLTILTRRIEVIEFRDTQTEVFELLAVLLMFVSHFVFFVSFS